MFAIVQGYLPEQPASFPDGTADRQEMWDVCYLCWAKNPRERAVISEIVEILRGIASGRITSSIPSVGALVLWLSALLMD